MMEREGISTEEACWEEFEELERLSSLWIRTNGNFINKENQWDRKIFDKIQKLELEELGIFVPLGFASCEQNLEGRWRPSSSQSQIFDYFRIVMY
ncbi:hypothetical protein AMTR_s00101p00134020 [Amborella trichopoda]|uniref:Uncharacterized protein n=1 Tax=Amborella trichopoda TaxID=13333 RepID=W1NWP9_AMBTC|nr:hypothetical protein AMTR_s00101p00134020 [Amborella trichopoda]